mgnify:FL=1
MTILTSRPDAIPATEELNRLVDPAVRVLEVVCNLVVFTDDTPASIKDAQEIVEETLDAFDFSHVVVMVSPSYNYELVYDCAVQPVPGASYISFKAVFKVRP